MSKSKRPSPEAMCVAAERLRCFQGAGTFELQVAAWLEREADQQDLRRLAKENEVSMKTIRRVFSRENL